MTTTNIRLFMEVTTRQAEEAFRRQTNESNHRIDGQMNASHGNGHLQAVTQPRELWWSRRETASRTHEKENNRG